MWKNVSPLCFCFQAFRNKLWRVLNNLNETNTFEFVLPNKLVIEGISSLPLAQNPKRVGTYSFYCKKQSYDVNGVCGWFFYYYFLRFLMHISFISLHCQLRSPGTLYVIYSGIISISNRVLFDKPGFYRIKNLPALSSVLSRADVRMLFCSIHIMPQLFYVLIFHLRLNCWCHRIVMQVPSMDLW